MPKTRRSSNSKVHSDHTPITEERANNIDNFLVSSPRLRYTSDRTSTMDSQLQYPHQRNNAAESSGHEDTKSNAKQQKNNSSIPSYSGSHPARASSYTLEEKSYSPLQVWEYECPCEEAFHGFQHVLDPGGCWKHGSRKTKLKENHL